MGFVKDLFSSKPDPVPTETDPEVEDARRRRRLAAAQAKGRGSTIYAGPGGVSDSRMLGRSVLQPGA